MYEANVFSAPVSACGQNQTIDILGLASLTVNALACPLAAGAPAAISLALVVPEAAKGLGDVTVIVNTTAASGAIAFCLNLTVPTFGRR